MTTSRTTRTVVLGAATALVLTACGGDGNGNDSNNNAQETVVEGGAEGEAVTGGELVVASLPSELDPTASTSRTNWMIAASVCEGLFANDTEASVQDGLVDSWDYDEDALEYTLSLRADVPFHDGSILTADDAVASLDRYRESASGDLFGQLVADITATGDLDLTITVNEPTGAIPALLATPDTPAYIMPASLLDGLGEDDTLDELVCTGPYQFDSFAADREAVISRFDDYASREEDPNGSAGAKTAYVDTIKFIPFNESNVLNQVRTGAVHVAPQFVGLDQLPVYENDQDLVPQVQENGGFSLIQFNHEEGLFTDLTMREALFHAVEPEELAIQKLGDLDYYSNSSSFFPEGSDWHSDAGQDVWEGRDPSLVPGLLEEAGYDGTPIRLLHRPNQDPYAPALRQQLEEAGFTVEMNAVDAATFTETRTDSSTWDIFLAGGTSYSDPLTVVFLGDEFPGWWVTEEKAALMADITAGADLAERKPAWDELQELLYTDLPFVKLGDEPRLAITSPDVGGFVPSKGTVRGFYNLWIED